jgi:hypothetical protein
LAIRKNKGFTSVIDPEGHVLFNLDRAPLSSLIGNNDFGGCALKLSTHLLRLMRLRRQSQGDERQDDKDAVSPSAYPIANTSN